MVLLFKYQKLGKCLVRKLIEKENYVYEIKDINQELFESSGYNWDDEWKYLIEDRGNEYITYAFYCNGILEGIMSIMKKMHESVEIYKLEVSAKNRSSSPYKEIVGIGTYLVSYACWLAYNVYYEEACSMVSLFSKKSSEGFYERLGAIKVEEIDDLYFLFTKDIVHKLALNIEKWEG